MIDKSRPAAQPPALPDFTPVPRQCNRHDGWTAERQQRFIEALADTGSVKAAAHRVNMAPEGAYQLRRHPQAKGFRKAWDAALAAGVQQLEDIAMERALHGTEVPVYSYGKLVGSRTVHNDRLLMFLLRNRAPARFAEGSRRGKAGDEPLDAVRLARLKKQWRKEWEEEKKPRTHEETKRVTQSITDKLRSMHTNWQRSLSPRTRELYAAYKASEKADRESGYRPKWDEVVEEEPD